MRSFLDAHAADVCAALGSRMKAEWDPTDSIAGVIPIGIEIEVKFSEFFPEIWRAFGLECRGVRSMSAAELQSFSECCTLAEAPVLKLLHETVVAGVPRGNDRWWEFALDPVHDVALLFDQVVLLSACGALPRNRPHSLQVTLGDIAPCPDVYYLAMLLELRTVDQARIDYGLSQAENTIFTGWARKGRAGVYEKVGMDLKHGSVVGCELRALQLPTDDETLLQLLREASWAANVIAGKQGARARSAPEAEERWAEFVHDARSALKFHGLPDRNWSNGERIDQAAWRGFAAHLTSLKETFIPVLGPARPRP